MTQQPPFPLPWGLHYQHRPPSRRNSASNANTCYEAAHTHAQLYTHRHAAHHEPTLITCKADAEETCLDYREQYQRCPVTGGAPCTTDSCEAVSSSQHAWGERTVSSTLSAPATPAPAGRGAPAAGGEVTRAEAASPQQLVSTTHTHAGNGRRGSLQLWQFLVSLLASGARCVAWTGRGLEFKLHEPEEVARRWGAQKNRPAMNYDKLSRSLRYYYEKGIMQKVAGERYVYKFVCDPDALFSMASPRARSPPPAVTSHPPAPPHSSYDVLTQLYGGVVPPCQYLSPPTHEYEDRRYYHHHVAHLGHYDAT